MKCPHCSNAKRIKHIDQKRGIGLILCLRCNKYFEVVNPPRLIRYTQSKLGIPSPRFNIHDTGNFDSFGTHGNEATILNHLLTASRKNRQGEGDWDREKVPNMERNRNSRRIFQTTLTECINKKN